MQKTVGILRENLGDVEEVSRKEKVTEGGHCRHARVAPDMGMP